jgi:hypothetical protein
MRTNCVAIDGISMDWKKLIQIKEIIWISKSNEKQISRNA